MWLWRPGVCPQSSWRALASNEMISVRCERVVTVWLEGPLEMRIASWIPVWRLPAKKACA
jgi:hypothetical protein